VSAGSRDDGRSVELISVMTKFLYAEKEHTKRPSLSMNWRIDVILVIEAAVVLCMSRMSPLNRTSTKSKAATRASATNQAVVTMNIKPV
jgi:hypothetical protein